MVKSKGKILVVDDNPTNLSLLVDYLADQGFELLAAEDGEMALELLGYVNPDIILLDVMMPGMNGFETCRHIKALPKVGDVPILFMTALTDTVDKLKGFEAGAVDYITKPVQPEEVLARITTHLTLLGLQRNLRDKNAQLEREIAERQRTEESLRESQHRLKTIFDTVQAGIVIVDAETSAIVEANPAALKMIGVESDQIIGVECHQFICPAEQGCCPVVNLGQAVDNSERFLLTSQGEMVSVLKTVVPTQLGGRNCLIESFVSIADRKRAENERDRLIKELVCEKEKSESLLLNILPRKIVDDLKRYGATQPETFDPVSVFLSDFIGFTEKAARLDPKLVVDELSALFTRFDEIMEQNQCERIKTIGDAYLAVCGMPEANERHAQNLIRAALQIIAYLEDRNRCHPITWQVRVGIHSGKVVGGIAGVKKYIYDVFGDTINTASRMENHSMAMKVNVSEATYKIARDDFVFLEREPIEVKGKGKMKMYLVEGDCHG